MDADGGSGALEKVTLVREGREVFALEESVHEVECFLCLRIKVLNHGAGELVRVILLEIDYLLEDIDIDRRGRRGVVGRVMSLGGVVVVVIVIVVAGGV